MYLSNLFAVGCSVTHFHFCQFFHNNVNFINISGHNICLSVTGIQAYLFIVFFSLFTAYTVRTFNNIVMVMYMRAIIAYNLFLCVRCLGFFALHEFSFGCVFRFTLKIHFISFI